MPGGFDILDEYVDEYDIDYDFGPRARSFISFKITIPTRMQPELIHGREITSERFQFTTLYCDHGPVTFVRSIDKTDVLSSTYIVLIREFLIRELARVSAPIGVKAVGPSPFWGNMMLIPSATIENELDVKWVQNTNAYDDIIFLYNSGLIKSTAAFGRLASAIGEQFSTYYFQVRARNKRYSRANIVAELTEQLISVHTRRGLRGWFAKTIRAGALAREAMLATITAKQLDLEERLRMSEDLRQTGTETDPPRLDLPRLTELCEREAKVTYVDKLAMAQEVASTLEGGRINQYEMLVVSASTLLGGAAGAVAALIAG